MDLLVPSPREERVLSPEKVLELSVFKLNYPV